MREDAQCPVASAALLACWSEFHPSSCAFLMLFQPSQQSKKVRMQVWSLPAAKRQLLHFYLQQVTSAPSPVSSGGCGEHHTPLAIPVLPPCARIMYLLNSAFGRADSIFPWYTRLLCSASITRASRSRAVKKGKGAWWTLKHDSGDPPWSLWQRPAWVMLSNVAEGPKRFVQIFLNKRDSCREILGSTHTHQLPAVKQNCTEGRKKTYKSDFPISNSNSLMEKKKTGILTLSELKTIISTDNNIKRIVQF